MKKPRLSYHMPEWKVVRDKEGNRYFLDQYGRIKTPGNPVFRYKPVSANGVVFYIHHGEELIKQRHRIKGLTILRSILSMPADENRVIVAQKKAGNIINSLKKSEGTRYERLKFEASLLLFQSKDSITLVNDAMRYKISAKGNLYILKKNIRQTLHYLYYGVKIGYTETYTFNEEKNIFDAIIAIDGERYSYKIRSLKMIRNHWRSIIGFDKINRKMIDSNSTMELSSFETDGNYTLGGFEGIFLNGTYSYCVKIILPLDKYKKNYSEMLTIIKSFTAVAGKAVR